MSGWVDWGTWEGGGLRREVFFFRSRGVELYGSLFASAELKHTCGVVACNSWGVEADRCEPLLRSVVVDVARRGGAGMVFHYPGYGDSHGELADVCLEDLGEAASDAVAEASRRQPGTSWTLAGLALGASVACLARQRAGAERLLLIQPALRPVAYFQGLSRRGEPLTVGDGAGEGMAAGTAEGMAYGYPVPRRIVDDPDADAAIAAALAAFEGRGAVVRHPVPAGRSEEGAEPIPERFERVDVPGRWRFGSRSNPRLAEAASGWLDRSARSAVA